jgi:dodecin
LGRGKRNGPNLAGYLWQQRLKSVVKAGAFSVKTGLFLLDFVHDAGELAPALDIVEDQTMTVARVTELSSTSNKSFQDAVEKGVKRASKTLRNVTGAWVKEHKVAVSDGKITSYQVNMMVTFVLED